MVHFELVLPDAEAMDEVAERITSALAERGIVPVAGAGASTGESVA
jgi:adenylate kinase